jgi:hypothetical protein
MCGVRLRVILRTRLPGGSSQLAERWPGFPQLKQRRPAKPPERRPPLLVASASVAILLGQSRPEYRRGGRREGVGVGRVSGIQVGGGSRPE